MRCRSDGTSSPLELCCSGVGTSRRACPRCDERAVARVRVRAPGRMPDQLTISVSENERVSGRVYRALDHGRIGATVVLGHGAGAGQLSSFMVRFAAGLASRGLDVLTFNFLSAEERRRAPDRGDKLEACYRAAIAAARGD